ncbi:transcriptional regulator family: Fungal Specific TF [Trichoderma harzianum]|nr:transcriptional regulator family: Fungal Specific TF [Trichoderma harzianum]
MGSGKEYLFINTSNDPSAEQKYLGQVRGFLMRNIRANQEWPKRRESHTGGCEEDAHGTIDLESDLRSIPTEQSFYPNCCDEWMLDDYGTLGDSMAVEGPAEDMEPSALFGQSQKHRGMSHTRQHCICAKSRNRDFSELPTSAIRKCPIDPFESLAVPLDASVGDLLAFFMDAISSEMTPITGKIRVSQIHRDWLQPSFSHPAFMHAILSLTALQLAAVQPQRRDHYSGLTLYHKGRAIIAVQHNLADSTLAISDENIAAVFNLLCVEENMFLPIFTATSLFKPDINQRQAHMQGLKEMIRLRGGVHGLGSFKPLQHLLIRHSVPRAAISFQKAKLLPPDLIGQLFHNYPKSSRFYGEPGPMWQQSSRIGVDSKLLDLIRTVECLLQDTRAWFEAPDTSPFDTLDLNTIYSMIISMCVRWYLTTESEGRLKSVDAILGLCLMQFTAFLCRSTCPARYSGPISVLERLNEHLFYHYHENMAVLHAANLDIWIGMLIVLSSDGISGYQDIFWNIYMEIIAKNRAVLRSFGDLQAILTTHCLWSPYPMDIHAKNIWDETPLDLDTKSVSSPEPAITKTRIQRTMRLAAALVSSNPYLGGHPIGRTPMENE